MRKKLIVTGKELSYMTRRLMPGETFYASRMTARALCKIGRACEVREVVEIPPIPAELLARFDHDHDGKPGGSTAQPSTDEIKALRATYAAKFGKRPFPGWNAEVLAKKIAEA